MNFLASLPAAILPSVITGANVSSDGATSSQEAGPAEPKSSMASETVASQSHEEEEADDDDDDDDESFKAAVQSSTPSVTSSDAAPDRSTVHGLPQTMTTFVLARPPPSSISRQRLGLRPRLLLQLQRISDSARPAPAFDIVPSTILPPGLTRNLRYFFGKDSVGPDDMVVMTSERYNIGPAPSGYGGDSSGDRRGSDSQQVVANIAQKRKEDEAQIYLSDGPLWHGQMLDNGSYEFVLIDNAGTAKARWVRRSLGPRRSGTLPSEKKFAFSMVKSSSRRHPVIATLTRTRLDVYDAYPSSVPPAAPRSPAAGQASSSSYFDAAPEPVIVQTDESLRTLIIVTGIYVAWAEGWMGNTRPIDPATSSADVRGAAVAGPSSSPLRSVSTPLQRRAVSNPLEPRQSPASASSSGDPSSSTRGGSPLNRPRMQAGPSTPTPTGGGGGAGGGQTPRRRAKSVGFDLPSSPGSRAEPAGQASHNGSTPVAPRARQESSRAPLSASRTLDGEADQSQSVSASEATESPRQAPGQIIQFPDALPPRRRRRWSRVKGFFRNLRPGSKRR